MQKHKKLSAFTICLLFCSTFLGMSSSTKTKETNESEENRNCVDESNNATGPGNWDLGYGAYDENSIWQLGMLEKTALKGFYGTYEENINCDAAYTRETKQTLYNDSRKDAQAAYIAQKFAKEQETFLNTTTATALQIAFWKNAGTFDTQITKILETQTTENATTINLFAEKYFTEAKKYAGPYQIEMGVNYLPGANTGQLKFQVHQKDDQKNMVPNIPVTLKIDPDNTKADVKFTENNAQEITVLSAEEQLSVDFTVFAGGTVFFELESSKLPAHIPYTQRMSLPTRDINNQQAIIITNIDNYENYNDAINTRLALDFDLSITTDTSTIVAERGEEIYDTLHVSLPTLTDWPNLPGTTNPVNVEVISTLYGPLNERPKQSNEIPTGTQETGVVTTLVNAAGSYETDKILVNEPGFYTWVERITAIPDGVNVWAGEFGIPAETTQIKWEPNISSDISKQIAVPGEQVFDNIYQIGFPENFETENLFVYANMYFVPERPEESEQIPDNAQPFDTQQVVAGNGTQTTESFAVFPEQQGCYTIVVSFAGNEKVNPYRSNFGIPSETTCTAETPPAGDLAEIVVVTDNSNKNLKPNSKISDTLMVSGLPEGAQVDIVSTLYGPFSEKPILQNVPPENIPTVKTVTTTVNNNGLHTTEAVQIPDVAHGSWFTWSESIVETETTLAWQGKFGVTAETSMLNNFGNETPPNSGNEIPSPETPRNYEPTTNNDPTLTSYPNRQENSVNYGSATNDSGLAKTGVGNNFSLLFLTILTTFLLGTVCVNLSKKPIKQN